VPAAAPVPGPFMTMLMNGNFSGISGTGGDIGRVPIGSGVIASPVAGEFVGEGAAPAGASVATAAAEEAGVLLTLPGAGAGAQGVPAPEPAGPYTPSSTISQLSLVPCEYCF